MFHFNLLFSFLVFLTFSNCVIGIKEQKHFNLTEKSIFGTSMNKVLVLSIDGIITSVDRKNFFMEEQSTISQIVGKLNKAKKDPNLKAVILKINSPGGTVTASDIIYQSIQKFKEEKKIPIIALFMDTAASGAYYIAMSADYIIANQTSITGSIGVVMKNINLQKGMEKFGIQSKNIASGKNKVLNDPFSKSTKEKDEILQSIVQQMYRNFITIVKKNRKNLDKTQENIIFDGRIFTSQQAKKLGLIDEIGYFEDSVRWLEKKLSLTNLKFVLYTYKRTNFNNIYQFQTKSQQNLGLFNELIEPKLQSKFLYLWNL